jgi:acetyl-CoA acetyltransferase
VGVVPHLSATQLCVKASKLALEDAGIAKDQLDGLITCASWAEPYIYHAVMIAEYMQIFPRYYIGAPAAGATTLAMLHHAASAIAAGVCNTMLIAAGDSLVSGAEQRAAVAVACRKHASLNAAAQMREPIAIEDVLNSRMVCDPLHLLDCSLVSLSSGPSGFDVCGY